MSRAAVRRRVAGPTYRGGRCPILTTPERRSFVSRRHEGNPLKKGPRNDGSPAVGVGLDAPPCHAMPYHDAPGSATRLCAHGASGRQESARPAPPSQVRKRAMATTSSGGGSTQGRDWRRLASRFVKRPSVGLLTHASYAVPTGRLVGPPVASRFPLGTDAPVRQAPAARTSVMSTRPRRAAPSGRRPAA